MNASDFSCLWRRQTMHLMGFSPPLQGSGRWGAQRSGIKEELAALGRRGGQPRSGVPRRPDPLQASAPNPLHPVDFGVG